MEGQCSRSFLQFEWDKRDGFIDESIGKEQAVFEKKCSVDGVIDEDIPRLGG
jgi:hypothetical protein